MENIPEPTQEEIKDQQRKAKKAFLAWIKTMPFHDRLTEQEMIFCEISFNAGGLALNKQLGEKFDDRFLALKSRIEQSLQSS